jgi:oxysterol-binding protein-related protein 8
MIYSTGKTPEEITKQILQIHAILPGQKPERQFSIPVRTNSNIQCTQSTTQPPPSDQLDQPVGQTLAEKSQQTQKPQEPQQQVGNLIDLDEPVSAAPQNLDHSLSKDTFKSDSSNPAIVPAGKANSQPQTISDSSKAKIDQELPPSKLLNSNPEPEPSRDEKLLRKDSETQEEDEFHDALT